MNFDFTCDVTSSVDGIAALCDAPPPEPAESIFDRDRLTFRTCFERFHLPVLKGMDAASHTYTTYRSTITFWERYGFPTLDVRALRQSHLLAFRAAIVEMGGSPSSFDARWACLKAVLGSVVAEGLMDALPLTPRVKKYRPDMRGRPTLDQFNRILAATSVATWPSRHQWRLMPVNPPTFWRSLYSLAYVTALRRGDLKRLRYDQLDPDGIRIVPRKTVRYGKAVFCPEVRGALAAALASMRGAHPELVFPPVFQGKRVADQQLAIAEAAGVPPKLALLHSFRRLSLDKWCEVDERAAGLISGHGLRGLLPEMTRNFYVSRDAEQARVEGILREAAARFHLPDEMQLT